jgi:hypothetical protein
VSDDSDRTRPWVKTRDGTVHFGLDTVGGFATDDGVFIPTQDVVDSSELAFRTQP